MKKLIFLLIPIIMLIANGCGDNSAQIEEISKNWIQTNAETYTYDGEDLKLIGVQKENSNSVATFEFISRHGGYGNREGMIVTQSLTPHTIVITIDKKDQILSAITDGVYDEVKKKKLLTE